MIGTLPTCPLHYRDIALKYVQGELAALASVDAIGMEGAAYLRKIVNWALDAAGVEPVALPPPPKTAPAPEEAAAVGALYGHYFG